MTSFVDEFETRYPTYEEVDALVLKARRMRARAMRDGVASIWAVLQHAVARKPAAAKGCEA